MSKIIFATKNRGKVREVIDIFSGTGFEIISLADLETTLKLKKVQIHLKGMQK